MIRVEFILSDGSAERRVLRREPKMGGFFRFLLGGVLGAAVGIAVSRKLAPAPRRTSMPSERFEFRPAASVRPTAHPTAPAPSVPITPTPTPAPWAEKVVEAAPQALMVEEALVVEEASVAAEPAGVWQPAPREEALVLEEVSEVVVTPEILEEPVAGTGWSSSTVLEEEAFESILPVIPEEALPEVSVEEVETFGPPEAEAATGPTTAAVPTPSVVEIPLGDDLRARIEATRRRIREELEKPFIAETELSGFAAPARETEGPVGEWAEMPGAAVAKAEPVASPASPAMEPEITPKPEETMVVTPAVLPEEPPEPAGPSSAADTRGHVLSPDYEAIKARIEMTRSRLKAKAFDAMMAGEAALLARDPAGLRPQPVRLEGIDGEIEQTVETTLREQEE